MTRPATPAGRSVGDSRRALHSVVMRIRRALEAILARVVSPARGELGRSGKELG